jgi:hypothetical protein
MKFYVYEHWRPDKDLPFYVGKGNGDRAFRLKKGRNIFYRRIAEKLEKLGMCVEVRMVSSGLSEERAHCLEVERIAFWRSQGLILANLTDGGEGVSGLKHSEKTKRVLREKSKHTSKQRMTDPKIRANLSAATTKYFSDPDNRRRHSILTVELMSDPEVRERISEAMIKISSDPRVKAARSKFMMEFLADPKNHKSICDQLSAMTANPEIKEAHRKGLIESWKDPDIADRRIKGMKATFARPEQKNRRADIMRQRMADPIYRQKMSNINKARHKANRDAISEKGISDIARDD